MRIGVMAAGAVGGYFGGRLVAAGHEVVFFARGRNSVGMSVSPAHSSPICFKVSCVLAESLLRMSSGTQPAEDKL